MSAHPDLLLFAVLYAIPAAFFALAATLLTYPMLGLAAGLAAAVIGAARLARARRGGWLGQSPLEPLAAE